jgi:hypothetical protein
MPSPTPSEEALWDSLPDQSDAMAVVDTTVSATGTITVWISDDETDDPAILAIRIDSPIDSEPALLSLNNPQVLEDHDVGAAVMHALPRVLPDTLNEYEPVDDEVPCCILRSIVTMGDNHTEQVLVYLRHDGTLFAASEPLPDLYHESAALRHEVNSFLDVVIAE